MSQRYDATTKFLVSTDPLGWLRYLGLPGTQARLVDMDISTISGAADRGILVERPDPYLAHIELQGSYKIDLDRRVFRYGAVLHYEYILPVQSVLVLLRREADGPAITGRVAYGDLTSGAGTDFRYKIVRVWQHKAEEMLNGGLGVLPLAPLADVTASELPEIVARMGARIATEAPGEKATDLRTATYILMGMKYEDAFIKSLLKGVREMRESTTYQAILEEGRLEGLVEGEKRGRAEGEKTGEVTGRAAEARRMILLIGGNRFGAPGAEVEAALNAIPSVDRLEALATRLMSVESWQELLS